MNCTLQSTATRLAAQLTTLVALACAAASVSAAEVPNWEALTSKHLTLGVWAGAPLGPSARLGLAWPLEDDMNSSVVGGMEFGRQGHKQFLGWRAYQAGFGVIMGGVDVARWKMNADSTLGQKSREYLGFEAQLMIFRAGLMWPREGGGGPRLTAAVGAAF